MLSKILKAISGVMGVCVAFLLKEKFDHTSIPFLVHYHQSELALKELRGNLCYPKSHPGFKDLSDALCYESTKEEMNALEVVDKIPGYCHYKRPSPTSIRIKLLDAMLDPCSIHEEEVRNFESTARKELLKTVHSVNKNQVQDLTFNYRKLVEASRTPSVLHSDMVARKCKKTNLANKYTSLYKQSAINHRQELQATKESANIDAGIEAGVIGAVAGVIGYVAVACNEESINNVEKRIKDTASACVRSTKEKLRDKIKGFQENRRRQ